MSKNSLKNLTIAIAGNPNCGKTTLFNVLTGTNQRVGNWSGVTVDKKTGHFEYNQQQIDVVDLPGVYSLSVSSASSTDESIARSYVLSKKADVIVNIVDASNLVRNLYLTTQLIEMKVPFILALNMMDVAKDRNIEINIKELEKQFGCKVIPMTARKNKGIEDLKKAVLEEIKNTDTKITYCSEIEMAISVINPAIERANLSLKHEINNRWLAIQMLEGDMEARGLLKDASEYLLEEQISVFEEKLYKDADTLIADGKYGFIKSICNKAIRRHHGFSRTITDKIDRVVLNTYFGIPIFMAFMYLMFMWTINIGGAFIDFFDMFFGALFVDGIENLLDMANSPDYMKVVFAHGVGGGIQTVATFIPVIAFLFLFMSALEDSGYMSRAAFVMDRFMRKIGLPGKAFVPLLIGFGCTVPAIMATRTLDKSKDRIMTILMSPFMSCGAKMPVYALFAVAFFKESGQNVVFGLYLIGIIMAVLTGLIMKNTILVGDASPMIMELPPYHMPTFRNVFIRTWERLKSFIFNAGKVIVPIVMILSFLSSLGTNCTFGNEQNDNSVLASIGRTITPVFNPMGISNENWPATVGIFTGIFAKEAVVGTLNSLYSSQKATEEKTTVSKKISEAFSSVSENLKALTSSFLDPLGMEITQDIGVEKEAFGEIKASFDGKIGAFAYLLFILLYCPCAAAVAAIYSEAKLFWASFVVIWTTGLAYCSAVFFYQVMTFSQHSEESLMYLSVITLLAVVSIAFLKKMGSKLGDSQKRAELFICKQRKNGKCGSCCD